MKTAAAKTVLLELAVPLGIFMVLSNFTLASSWALALWDRYRPTYQRAPSVGIFVESQILHLQRMQTVKPRSDRTIAIGSSAVVNGVDVTQATGVIQQGKERAEVVKYAATGLMAYELPLLADEMLAMRPKAMVYLYNTFSFGDQVHPQAIRTRWDTLEFLRIAKRRHLRKLGLEGFSDALAGELFFAARFKTLLRQIIMDKICGSLMTNDEEYDYPANEPIRSKIARVFLKPIPPTDPNFWFRASYFESASGRDTLGYRGLARFLDIAAKHGIQVIVAPIPEPEFALYLQYKQGIDQSLVDAHVQFLCRSRGVTCVKRSWVEDMEVVDAFFRDGTHMSAQGRALFSTRLGHMILAETQEASEHVHHSAP